MLGALVGSLLLDPDTDAAALAGRLHDTGIDEDFLEEVRTRITPGTSALLVLSSEADLEAVRGFVEVVRHLDRQHAAWRERREQARQQTLVIEDPLQRRVGEDEIWRPVRVPGADIAQLETYIR